MIYGISTHTDEPNVEQFALTIIKEDGSLFEQMISKSDLSTEKKVIYSVFIDLIQNKERVSLSNAPGKGSFDRFTNDVLVDEDLYLNYNTLSEEDKIKITNFVSLTV